VTPLSHRHGRDGRPRRRPICPPGAGPGKWVAERDHLSVARVQRLVDRRTEGRTPGFVGEPRVNVLVLDIALEELVAKN
jgi:hypothetical protein